MKKNLTFTLFTLFVFQFNSLSAQDSAEHEITNAELLKRLLALENENKAFKLAIHKKDSIRYEESINTMLCALEGGDVLKTKIENTVYNMTKDPMFIKLIEVNNPTSDALGFKFTDVVIDASKKSFTQGLSDGNEKKRWNNIVAKLTQNDIVKSLLQSNPITSLVSSIVSVAANFSITSSVGRSAVETKDAFNEEQLKEFNSTLQPYINFYDKLIIAGNNYQTEIKRLDEKYAYLKTTASQFHHVLIKKLGLTSPSPIALSTQLNALYKCNTVEGRLAYSETLDKDKIKTATEFVKDYDKLKVDVESLSNEYAQALNTFLQDYKVLLVSAKETFRKEMDTKKIDAVIAQIDAFLVKLVEYTAPNQNP